MTLEYAEILGPSLLYNLDAFLFSYTILKIIILKATSYTYK